MLRLWRDQLSLALAADRIVLVRASGGLRPKIIVKEIVPVTEKEGGWKGVLETLGQTLKNAQWQDAATHVVLPSCSCIAIHLRETLAHIPLKFCRTIYFIAPRHQLIAHEAVREHHLCGGILPLRVL